MTNYIVFSTVAEAEAAHDALAATYGYPNEASKTYRVFDVIADYNGSDPRGVAIVSSYTPPEWESGKPRMSKAALIADGFTFMPSI